MERGHRWVEGYNGFRLPVQPYQRWLCDAERPDPTLPAELQGALDAEIAFRHPRTIRERISDFFDTGW